MPHASGLLPSSPRILITNDDGIHAPGLKILEEIARELSDDVWIVAPEQEQSGAAHSLTLHLPVRIREVGARAFAVSGTPTDCVLLAARQILKGQTVDLVLSGVNRGSNVGDDVTYSGTVAAAMEATLLGIPAIALSQLFSDFEAVPWETATAHAVPIIRRLVAEGWPKGTLINLNFPDCPANRVRGVAPSPQGRRVMSVGLSERADPRGRPYFWIGGDRDNAANGEEVDVAKLDAGFITVTPIHMDMTNYPALDKINELFREFRV